MRLGTELVGYLASALVLLTFLTTKMRTLRVIAILSNLAFLAYGALDGIVPVLGLHAILLPLNLHRLLQLERSRQLCKHRADPEPVTSGRSLIQRNASSARPKDGRSLSARNR